MDSNFNIEIEKITTVADLREANSFTSGADSKMSLKDAYHCRHSPIRTQLFKIKMYNIFSFVSVHLVRHSAVGQLHFVQSMRDDRGGDGTEDRYTPVNHLMILNAGHIIEMMNARLCRKASPETREVVNAIKKALIDIDPALVPHCVPRCLAINYCRELKSCGYLQSIRDKQEAKIGDKGAAPA